MKFPVIWAIALILAFIASVSTASGADPPPLDGQPALLIWPTPVIQGPPPSEAVTHAVGACQSQPLLILCVSVVQFAKGRSPEYPELVSDRKE